MPVEPTHKCIPIVDGLHFCFPKPKNTLYYLGFDKASHPDSKKDGSAILDIFFKPLFKKPKSIPELSAPPANEEIPKPNWRTYNVTDLLPKGITEFLGKWGRIPGPNCYQAALCAMGFDDVCGRYVDSGEAEYLLSLFFKQTRCANRFGQIIVFKPAGRHGILPSKKAFTYMEDPRMIRDRTMEIFDEKKPELMQHIFVKEKTMGFAPTPGFSPGNHMATSLFGDVFQKASWHHDTIFEIVPRDKATYNFELSFWEHMDRFERINRKFEPEKYSETCFELARPIDFPKGEALSKEKRHYYITLFDYYSKRITEMSANVKGSETFDEYRPSLLTVENLWKVLSRFRNEIRGVDPKDLALDSELMTSFERAHSLSWQVNVMGQQYYKIRDAKPLEELKILYKKHYFKFDKHFKEEVARHLIVELVPKKHWNSIYNDLIAELTRLDQFGKPVYDPEKYAAYNGGTGAPFNDILNNIVAKYK